MYGLITRVVAQQGQRDAVAELLVDGLANRPGCLGFVVSLDAAEGQALWVHEVWVSESAHKASLEPAEVRALTVRVAGMITQIHDSIQIRPVGGRGLG
jgi:Uncharacterized conserved protein